MRNVPQRVQVSGSRNSVADNANVDDLFAAHPITVPTPACADPLQRSRNLLRAVTRKESACQRCPSQCVIRVLQILFVELNESTEVPTARSPSVAIVRGR
jgi:hypothetical protein